MQCLLRTHVQMAVYYFFSLRVTRSVVYGVAARNRLDIHRPPGDHAAPPHGYPVVVYITGMLNQEYLSIQLEICAQCCNCTWTELIVHVFSRNFMQGAHGQLGTKPGDPS